MTLDALKIVERLVEKRRAAQRGRDYAKAAALEDDLSRMNVRVSDGPHGTRWTVGQVASPK